MFNSIGVLAAALATKTEILIWAKASDGHWMLHGPPQQFAKRLKQQVMMVLESNHYERFVLKKPVDAVTMKKWREAMLPYPVNLEGGGRSVAGGSTTTKRARQALGVASSSASLA
eukprot:6074115-Pyramimonas_sp.AAC.1